MSRARLTTCLVAVIALVGVQPFAVPTSDGDTGTPIVVHVEQGGFRWADAGVGALIGGGFTLAAFGCLAVVRSRGPGETPSRKARES